MVPGHPAFNTFGIPAEVSVESGPCSLEQDREPTLFGFVSARYTVQIGDPNGGTSGGTFSHQADGENLSCATWGQEDGPGRLVLGLGAIHGASEGVADLVTVFVLDD